MDNTVTPPRTTFEENIVKALKELTTIVEKQDKQINALVKNLISSNQSLQRANASIDELQKVVGMFTNSTGIVTGTDIITDLNKLRKEVISNHAVSSTNARHQRDYDSKAKELEDLLYGIIDDMAISEEQNKKPKATQDKIHGPVDATANLVRNSWEEIFDKNISK